MTALIISPELFLRELIYTVPVLDESDMPTGQYETKNFQAASWTYVVGGVGWDFLTRVQGAVVWEKPHFVIAGRNLGVAKRTIMLEPGVTYEFLPLADVNPNAV